MRVVFNESSTITNVFDMTCKAFFLTCSSTLCSHTSPEYPSGQRHVASDAILPTTVLAATESPADTHLPPC